MNRALKVLLGWNIVGWGLVSLLICQQAFTDVRDGRLLFYAILPTLLALSNALHLRIHIDD